MAAPCPAVYRPRRPKASPLYRLVEQVYDEVKEAWEERYEATCGRWRGLLDEVVYAFLDCGDLHRGFARVFCDSCHREYLLAFSCSRRGFCPSCAAKRGALFGAFLQEEVLEPVGHCLWTFTIPKLLRPYFLHHRHLLGPLCRAAWHTVAALLAEAAGRDLRPGMVAAVHTASSDLRWHPHVHGIVSRGGWDEQGEWVGVPYVDERAGELLFRHQVLSLLAREDLVGPDRIALLDSWKSGHTGFSAHNRVTVTADDAAGLERMARYLLRPPLSLERLHLDGPVARYRHKRAASSRGESFDSRDLLARLLMHIPAPRLHLVRYYGRYSNVARARRKASPPATHGAGGHNTELPGAEDHHAELPADAVSTTVRRRLRRQWAQLIRRIYEADPLLCTCGATLRILSFLTDPSVVEKILDHLERTLRAAGRDPPGLDADSHSRAS